MSSTSLPNFTLETQGDMKTNWEDFSETFESYVTLMGYRSGTKDPAKELAALKYSLPKEARLVLKNSIKWNEGQDKSDPALTLNKLGIYYSGTKNVIHERVEFNKLKCRDDEKMNEWETRCRNQGNKCEYCASCTPQLIRDRFIVGINDDRLMSKLVNSAIKDPELSLESTVLQAQQYESTTSKIREISDTPNLNEQVNFAKSSNKPKNPFTKLTPTYQPQRKPQIKPNTCPWCAGSPHPSGKEGCPAKGIQCNACGRMDHYARACLHPTSNWRASHRENRDYPKKEPIHIVTQSNDYDDPQFDNFSIDHKDTQNSQSVNYQSSNPTGQHRDDLVKRARTMGRNHHQQIRTRPGQKYFANIKVINQANPYSQSTSLKFQIDTGATCNIMPKDYLEQLGPYTLGPSNSVMYMYNNVEVIPDGTIELLCRRNNRSLTLQFQVVSGQQFSNKSPLICGTDCELLNLIHISADEVHASTCQPAKEPSDVRKTRIMDKYHDVFTGLGQIGDPVHIELDPTVRPIQARMRRYPVTKIPAISSRIF